MTALAFLPLYWFRPWVGEGMAVLPHNSVLPSNFDVCGNCKTVDCVGWGMDANGSDKF